VYSNSCRIMEVDPYKNEVMRHFKRIKYKSCQKLPPLTQVKFEAKSQKYLLSIDGAAFGRYPVGKQLHCCYMSVQRVDEMKVKYTKCQTFKGSILLPDSAEGIIVKCDSGGRQIYINGHATVPVKEAVQQRLRMASEADAKGYQRPPSVLMLGIDSISRVNLIRAMPKTAQYLYDNGWFELAGYNKVRLVHDMEELEISYPHPVPRWTTIHFQISWLCSPATICPMPCTRARHSWLVAWTSATTSGSSTSRGAT